MTQIEPLLKEMEQEAQTTRKMLERVPADKFDWAPHPKSMKMRNLATHIAELPGWVKMAVETDELDFARNEYKPTTVESTADLVALFDRSLAEGKAALASAQEAELSKDWTLRHGERIFSTNSKAEVIRMSYCQTVHHRAQLGVYLRLLDIPIPGSYGPSADEPW